MIHLDGVIFTPLPQLRLKNALVEAGHEPDDIVVLEHSRNDSLQAMLDEIVTLKPQVVGFSCYTWNFLAVERLSEALKAHLPATLVVWGGPHVSELPQRFLSRYPASVDAVITWYGEGSFVEVVAAHEAGLPVAWSAEHIPGVFAQGLGTKATEYPHITDLGYPYRYLPPTVQASIAERVFLIESYRNCPFSCSYCLWGQAQKSYDALSADTMVEQMYAMVDQGARIFMYADAGLGLIREGGRQRDLEVYQRFAADEVLRRNKVELRGYFFWQTMADDTLDAIKALIAQGVMGQLDIGIQTFNPSVLPDLQRPTNYDKFFTTVERLHERDIRFSLDLILGLPGDNLEGFRHSLRSVIRCRPDRTQSFPLSILPGTAYDLRRAELGIETIRGSFHDDAETVIATNTFSYGDMQQALELEAWMFLYYAEGLFARTLNALADRSGVEPLSVLEALKDWAQDNAPALCALVAIYRAKLYDSRSDGRYGLEQTLMDRFAEVYSELLAWVRHEHAIPPEVMTLRHELAAFPKTKAAAESLKGIDGLQYTDEVLYHGETFMYHWQRDPVIGAIVRNRNFYMWKQL